MSKNPPLSTPVANRKNDEVEENKSKSQMSQVHRGNVLLVFWMCTWVDDSVHVQVQIVKFNLVGVWFGGINRNTDSITLFTLLR